MPAQTLPPITERTYEVVQDLMHQEGLSADDPIQVALYIERLIARERFFRTADRLRQQVADVAPDELQRMIDEAVEEVTASHRGGPSSADRT